MLSQSPAWQVEADAAHGLHEQLDKEALESFPPSVQRSPGVTKICLGLGCLGFAGLLWTAIFILNEELPIPRWIGIFSFAYGTTALTAAYRVWRMKDSGVFWFRCWAAVVMLGFVAMIPILSSQALGGVSGLVGVTVIAGSILWLIDRYLDRNLRAGIR